MTPLLIGILCVIGAALIWIHHKSEEMTIEINKSIMDILDIHDELHKIYNFKIEQLEMDIQYLKEKYERTR